MNSATNNNWPNAIFLDMAPLNAIIAVKYSFSESFKSTIVEGAGK